MALPEIAPTLVLVAQGGVRDGSGNGWEDAAYASQSKSDLINCGPNLPSLLARNESESWQLPCLGVSNEFESVCQQRLEEHL